MASGVTSGEPTSAIDETRPTARDTLRPWRRLHRWFWALLGWSTMLGVLAVLFFRARDHDGPLTIALVGLTAFLALPISAAAVAAWLSGQRSLRVGVAATFALFLVLVGPADAVVGCGNAEPTRDEFTLYTANVLFFEGRPDDIAASIEAADADVVVMQEMRWQFTEELAADPRMADYRYKSTDTRGAPESTAVWSRWPIVSTEISRLDRVPLAENVIDGPNGRFTVTGIHLTAPARPSKVAPWNRELEELDTQPIDGARIMAGDFNATEDHLGFRRLLDDGWTDVHQVRGCGLDATWPVGRGLPFPVLRLDHVLVTDDVEVLGLDFGDPGGSDHKPVIARLRLVAESS